MRSTYGRIFAAVVAMLVLGIAPAHAASVADASVTVTSAPESVSPPGGIVLYRVVIRNGGPAPAPVDATDETVGGTFVAASSQIPDECNAPDDGTTDPVVSCSFEVLFPEETRRISVAIRTPSTVGSVTNTATVAVPPNTLDVFDDNTSNDTASVTTPVVFALEGSATLLQEGESLAFRGHLLTVRASNLGVIATMRDAPAEGDMCGTVLCDAGLHVGFDPDAEYQGDMGLVIDFGKGNPCRGIGGGANCGDLYMRKDGVVTKVPRCSSAPEASPCIELVEKTGPALRWTVRLRSEDPDFIPPLSTAS